MLPVLGFDEESVKALVAATVKDMGQVDILVNSRA